MCHSEYNLRGCVILVDVVADDCKEVEADKHKHKHLHSLMAVSDEEAPSERKYPYN